MSVLEERYATVGGTKVRYLLGGRGKPLVLCHGFLSSAEEFGGRFQELAAQRTLIVPDLPGNAGTPPLPGPHTAEHLAGVVATLLDQLGVGAFDLAGLCLGASVACALLEQRGEQVGRLVLHTPLLRPNLIRARYRYQVRALTLAPVWHGATWMSRQRTLSDLYKRYVIQEGAIDATTSDINFENQRRADPRAAKEWLCDALRRDDLGLVAAHRDPTLMIVARNDRLVHVPRLEQIIASLPQATLCIDDEAGHGWSAGAVRRQLVLLQAFFDGQ